VSEAGRPACLIKKSRNSVLGKYDTTVRSPHETFVTRNNELLHLSENTEEVTHKDFYDMDHDSFHMKKKYNRHQLLLDGEVRE
jgi:hypothetical protein